MTSAARGNAEILTAIYDAVLDPSHWDEVARRIVAGTNSVSASLAIQRGDTVELSGVHNIDPAFAEAYKNNWYRKNPLDDFKTSVAPGELRAYSPVTQSDEFKASSYFNEFIHPQGWGDGVVTCLHRGPASAGYFAIIRSPHRMWVEPEEWHLLETIVPHLQRAAEVHRLLSHSRAITDSLGQAFTVAGFAVFLVNEDCQILFNNAKAEELLRCRAGLQYCWGRLVATDHVVGERLQALVRGGQKPGRGDSGGGGTLELRHDDEGRPLIAHVIPLAVARTLAILDREHPAAAVFVVDPGADLLARVQHFAARFGLTGAETRVLAEIISGNGIHVAAGKLKVTEGTARTHAKRVLAKTGTTRQSELIRRFFDTSLPGSPGLW